MRLILELNSPLEPQLKAAQYAITEGIKKGDRWGVRIDDPIKGIQYFSVKHNATSIRIYP